MRRARAGFTLVEIIIVMAIVLLVAAISIGSIRLMYADEGTINASDTVRAQWAQAQRRAINDGVPYVFGVVWNEGVWRIAPEGADYWGAGAAPMQNDVSSKLVTDAGRLDADVCFVESGSDKLPDVVPSSDPNKVDVDRYQQLLTFYPDGSVKYQAPDGSSPEVFDLYLEGRTKLRRIISLRILTGSVTTAWE